MIKDDKVWRRMKRDLLSINKKVVRVGFFEESRYGPENDNLPVATVAAIQELGSESIPPRAFVREGTVQAIRRGAGGVQKKMKKSVQKIAEKSVSTENELQEIGNTIAAVMKTAIETWTFPPNAPSTVAKKGRNDPLVDSSYMKDSVKAKVRRK